MKSCLTHRKIKFQNNQIKYLIQVLLTNNYTNKIQDLIKQVATLPDMRKSVTKMLLQRILPKLKYAKIRLFMMI